MEIGLWLIFFTYTNQYWLHQDFVVLNRLCLWFIHWNMRLNSFIVTDSIQFNCALRYFESFFVNTSFWCFESSMLHDVGN